MKHCLFYNPFRNIRFQEYTRIADMDTKEWSSIGHPHLFLSLDFLKIQERLLSDQMTFTYLMVYEHDRLLGIAFFQECRIPPAQYFPVGIAMGGPDGLEDAGDFLGHVADPALRIGNQHAYGQAFQHPGKIPSDLKQLLRVMYGPCLLF